VAANIGISHIIADDNDNIRPLPFLSLLPGHTGTARQYECHPRRDTYLFKETSSCLFFHISYPFILFDFYKTNQNLKSQISNFAAEPLQNEDPTVIILSIFGCRMPIYPSSGKYVLPDYGE
jgi:hypothetical protein